MVNGRKIVEYGTATHLVVPDGLYCDCSRPRQAAGPPGVCPDPHQELPLRVGGEGARHYQVLPLLHTQAQGHLLNFDTQQHS